MFRRFAGSIPDGANELFLLHPLELSALLELAWDRRLHDPAANLGSPRHRSNLPGLFAALDIQADGGRLAAAARGQPEDVRWDHLIYAFMIENTRVYGIFRRVVSEFISGERLGVPDPASQHWLRNTEELFYREPAPFTISAITSYIRPDLGATRRNAYQRMFDMELNHGMDDNRPYTYPRAESANQGFVATFEEFLREVWIGIINVKNASGVNPTDEAKIRDLVKKLRDMLLARRQNGNLSREEFVFVTTMSWFHLTLDFNSPIVDTLRAQASSPEQRLFKIAERVGLPAHGLSRSFFDIADPISRILIQIEAGEFDSAIPALFTPAPDGPAQDLSTIITHWSAISGRDIKAGKVSTS
ncbi:hypothetical protein [Streptomyces rhizosphaericus]|uniref:Uncharacterized protein n=1 Tax=Streptomyces rhizosphaericus TaxID=114699 RepID=A0A6G4ASV5_9ACTN|nr:hypothetical protein [Streptomyces rhizosphaericus]NEW75547.1 hypothetical protein [Streptomyces rhizosphaericus]